jgi:hypothetical protein
MWLRLQWWRPAGRATREIRERPELAAWLDAVANLASITRTSPRREQRTPDYVAKVAGHSAALP